MNGMKSMGMHHYLLLETMYSSLTEVLVGCIEECVPKKMVSLSDKKSNPHWMNEEV